MKRHFCTYLDKNYLARGLVLYRSLEKTQRNFTLHILCMDNVSFQLLKKLKLGKAKLIQSEQFIDKKLEQAQKNRSLVEFYWTCTPSLPLYVFKQNPEAKMVTYVDADLMFFSSPEEIFKEFGDNSLMLIEHRFPKDAIEGIKANGKYCVQYQTFRRDKTGLDCLKRWRNQCIDWCYYKQENGLMGDQAYLQEWEKLYKKIVVIKNLGVGLAPWNIANYKLSNNNQKIFVNNDRLVFYHYHALRPFSLRVIDPSEGYRFTSKQLRLIYRPYYQALRSAYAEIRKIDPKYNAGFVEGVGRHILYKIVKWCQNALRSFRNT